MSKTNLSINLSIKKSEITQYKPDLLIFTNKHYPIRLKTEIETLFLKCSEKVEKKIQDKLLSYLKLEPRTYRIYPRQIKEIIKFSKVNSLRLAIEEDSSAYLKNTKKKRDKLEVFSNYNKEELSKLLVGGIITTNRNADSFDRYSLLNTFPNEDNSIKKALKDNNYHLNLGNLDSSDVLQLLFCAEQAQIDLYLDIDASLKIKKQETNFKKQIAANKNCFPSFITAGFAPKIYFDAEINNQNSLSFFPKLTVDKEFLLELNPEIQSFIKTNSKTLINNKTATFYFEKTLVPKFLDNLTEIKTIQGKKFAIPRTDNFSKTISSDEFKQFKINSDHTELSDIKLDLKDKPLEGKLFPHQRIAISWILKTKNAFLGDDMGLGKTLSTLASAEELSFNKEIDLLIIVCPNSLKDNWEKEAKSWLFSFKTRQLPKNKRHRISVLDSIEENRKKLDALILNYESLRQEDVRIRLERISKKYKIFLCLDESQKAKNSQSKTYKSILKIADEAERKILLSGTPIPRDISDIWAQFRILDSGKTFGTNYYAWLKSIAKLGTKWSDYAVKDFKKDEIEKTISKAKLHILRRKKEDVVNLPEKLFTTRYIKLNGSQKDKYEMLRKELLILIRSIDGDSFQKEINNILEQYLRAVQIASNPRLIDKEWKGEPAKFTELDSIVEEIVIESQRKLLIWTNYVDNVYELKKRYKPLGTLSFCGKDSLDYRKNAVEDFQSKDNKSNKIMIAVPAAGGVGITLTQAQTAVYIDKTWNAEHWLQSIDRIHRIGQTGTVNIISLNSCPIDYLIETNLEKKTKLQARLLDSNLSSPLLDEIMPTKDELIEALEATDPLNEN